MDHISIIKDIRKKNIAPVYFLMGEEPYFIDEITNCMEDDILSEGERVFGLNIVYGRDVSMKDVLHMARAFPMSGDRQVVLVKEAQDMKDWKKSEEVLPFESYLKAPVPSTVLVFAYKDKSFDKRLKISKAILKYATVFTSDRIKENKLADWIEGYVASHGASIDHAASNLIAEYLGNDLGKVVNELGKLLIIVPKGTAINAKHIEDNIGISKDYNVWELQKALAGKDVLKSNRIINYFESNPKANPIQMVLPSLYSYFSKIAIYASLPDKRSAAEAMGVNPYVLNDYRLAAGNYSPQKIERIFGYLRDADRKCKGVGNVSVEDGMLMKELVFKILH